MLACGGSVEHEKKNEKNFFFSFRFHQWNSLRLYVFDDDGDDDVIGNKQ